MAGFKNRNGQQSPDWRDADVRPVASMSFGQPALGAGVSSAAVYDAIAAEVDGKIRKRRRWTVVFVVALLIFLASLAALGVLAFSYLQGQQKYDAVADLAAVKSLEDGGEIDLSVAVPGQDGSPGVQVDWAALAEQNPDTVAWLYVPGTVISYPVVQAADNEYYLTRDFDGDQGWLANYGAIFMDYQNNPDWSDRSYFIFGHHMRDGSMFADFVGFENQQRFDECRTIYLLSPSANFKLRTFSVVHCSPDDALVVNGFDTTAQMVDYIQDKMDRSIVSVSDALPANRMGKIFAFATCDNASWGRYVVYAYVEDASDEGLKGTIGIQTEDGGGATGFVEEVEVEEERG